MRMDSSFTRKEKVNPKWKETAMNYHKTITLKDGRTCTLRNGTAEDGRALLKIFNLTHTQTDYLRTYPEEHSYTAEDEAELLRRNRPVTTLFMLMSVDGKISTGAADELDVDRDFPTITGLREGLHQYYEIEQTPIYGPSIPAVSRQKWASTRHRCLKRFRYPSSCWTTII